MLIRFQERTKLINFDKVAYTEIGEWYGGKLKLQGYVIQMYFDKGIHENAGIYSSRAKAIKVLDMVCAFADGHHYEQVKPFECGYIGGEVFQMPQDSEVEG